jgi:general secretion pathway protein A
MDQLAYWNLTTRPFEATWDSEFYFHSPEHEEALERLTFLVSEESMNLGMLSGEIGCGKTLLRGLLAQRLDENRFEVVVQESSGFPFKDLLCAILRELGAELKPGGVSKMACYERFKEMAGEIYDAGRHLVLIFDESQEMDVSTLNDLKLLLNLNADGENFLTILLIGQPELRKRVSKVPAVDQRISLRFHLTAFTLEESADYIQHRLRIAGHPTGELFTQDSIEQAFYASRGIPRELNRVAKLALDAAWAKNLPLVTRAAVDAVVRDLERYQNLHAA